MRVPVKKIEPSDLEGLPQKDQFLLFDEKMLEIATSLYGVNKSEALSISFVTFLVFECEKKVAEGVEHMMKVTSEKVNEQFMSSMLNELTFTGKINTYENMLKQMYPDGHLSLRGISYFRQLNEIRNKLFHCKIKDILYKGKSITNINTRVLMIDDYFIATGVKQ